MIKKVLIAVEEFELAEKTVSKAIEITKQLDAELGIINVVNSEILYNTDSTIMLSDLIKNIKLKSENLINDLRHKFNLDKVETFIEEGPIVDTLIKKSIDWNADIIITGSHVRKGLDKLITGSIAQEILNKSKIPVMVITKNVK